MESCVIQNYCPEDKIEKNDFSDVKFSGLKLKKNIFSKKSNGKIDKILKNNRWSRLENDVDGDKEKDGDKKEPFSWLNCFRNVLSSLPIFQHTLPRVHEGFWGAYSSVRVDVFKSIVNGFCKHREKQIKIVHLLKIYEENLYDNDNDNDNDNNNILDNIINNSKMRVKYGIHTKNKSPNNFDEKSNNNGAKIENEDVRKNTRSSKNELNFNTVSPVTMKNILKELKKPLRVYFCGHSLGAALAVLAALDLSVNLNYILDALEIVYGDRITDENESNNSYHDKTFVNKSNNNRSSDDNYGDHNLSNAEYLENFHYMNSNVKNSEIYIDETEVLNVNGRNNTVSRRFAPNKVRSPIKKKGQNMEGEEQDILRKQVWNVEDLQAKADKRKGESKISQESLLMKKDSGIRRNSNNERLEKNEEEEEIERDQKVEKEGGRFDGRERGGGGGMKGRARRDGGKGSRLSPFTCKWKAPTLAVYTYGGKYEILFTWRKSSQKVSN